MEAHAATIAHAGSARQAPGPPGRERSVGWLFGGAGLALFALMGLLGLVMRLTQADVLDVSASWFYRILTLHGAGMLVGALLACMGALWFVLRQTVPLSLNRMLWSFGAVITGVVAVVIAVGVGGFATGWTFLSPLPFLSAGQWESWATGFFLVGMVLVGAGFSIFCIDVVAKTSAAYGGVGGALGIPLLRGRNDSTPPPQVIAATAVAIEGLVAVAVGTTLLLALLGRTIDADVEIDALWAKNLTFFFGHSLANLIIYLAAGMVYVLLPQYTGRPWKTTKPIVIAWLATLVLVMAAYSHHLYMDFVQPQFAQYVSTIASSAAALPAAVVTIYTGMMLVWGSRYRWTLASTLLYLGFAGWAIGGTAAVLDSVIPLNFRLHNSLWVPAHFHTYLAMGVMLWVMAFVAHLLERAASRAASRLAAVAAPALMVIGGYGLVGAWYGSGALGVPRRYPVHSEGTEGYSVAGSIFAAVFAIGFLVLLVEFATLARDARRRRAVAVPGAAKEVEVAPEPPAEPAPSPPLTTPVQLAIAVAAGTIAVAALFGPIVDASEVNAQYHHLAHAAYFFLGGVFALAVASSPSIWPRVSEWRSGPALAAVIAAPAVMLLIMIPGIYGGLEDRWFLHFLYHDALIALGVVVGFGAAMLGRSAGRLVFVLAIGMATMYAAGVTGG